MRVLVTGGAGYLGCVLVRQLLEAGMHVRVVDKGYFGFRGLAAVRGDIELIEGVDVRTLMEAHIAGCEAVVHLGGLSNDPTAEFSAKANQSINVGGSERVWSLCASTGRKIRLVYASTASLYDGLSTDTAWDEQAEVNLHYPYSRSKYEAEQALWNVAGRAPSTIRGTVLRMGTLYGWSHRMRLDLAINAMVWAACQTGVITVHSDGMQWRPMVHVEDAAAAYVRVLQAPWELGAPSRVYNVVAKNWLLLDLAHRLAALVGPDVQVNVTYGQERRRSYRVDGSAFRRAFGWEPVWSLTKTVPVLQEMYKSQPPDLLRSANLGWMAHLLEIEELLRVTGSVL